MRFLVPLLLSASLAASPAVVEGSREIDCEPFAFREVAEAVGVSFVHHRGSTPEKRLPETMGSGLAWLDADGDGWLDLYLVQSGPSDEPASPEAANRLFRNVGGRFVEVREAGGAGDRGYGQGVVAGDFDGDRSVDLYVTNRAVDRFYRNRGDGTFEVGAPGVADWSSSAAFADGDGDGDLDLYVTRYLDLETGEPIFCGDPETGERRYCDPSLFEGLGDRYLENLGPEGFSNRTEEAGLASADGRGLGVLFTDLTGDGAPDLYTANDLTLNLLFRNRGDGTFEDLSLLSGAAVNLEGKAEAGMGLAVGDVDGDLDPDLAVTNFDVETNTLYRNEGDLFFLDVSAESGFGVPSFNRLAFGLVMADFDGDGILDVYVGNGHIFEDPAREHVRYEQPDQLFRGVGKGGFLEVPCPALGELAQVTRGVAAGDYDDDGDLDLGVQANGGRFQLLENEISTRWIGVRLRGPAPNTGGIGAKVELTTDRRRRVSWVLAGSSYQSSSDPRILFSLGEEETPLALEVVWPWGRGRTRIRTPATGGYLEVVQPENEMEPRG